MWCGVVWCGAAWSVWFCFLLVSLAPFIFVVVFSLFSGVLKRFRELDPRGRSRTGCRAVLCGCLECVYVSGPDCSLCNSCVWPADGPGLCPCPCEGCQPMEVPTRRDLPTRALCSFPGCFVPTPLNSVTGVRARCCGSTHERIFLRLDQCPSTVPPGPLISVSVYGPGLGAWAPAEILVSPYMTVGDLAWYISAVFLEYSSLEEVALPRSMQLRLMPGALLVSDLESFLLYPPASSVTPLLHLRCFEQSMTLQGVGIQSRSVLSLTHLPFAAVAVEVTPAAVSPVPAWDVVSSPASGRTDSPPPSAPDSSMQAGFVGSTTGVISTSSPDSLPDGETYATCDCLHCSNAAAGGGSRCLACWWTQFDPCPCTCAGCLSPEGIQVRCVLPGCVDFGYFDFLTMHRERCCGLPHEQMLARLELCPSVMPGGHLTSISVFGPAHDPPGLPVKLLVSLGMPVEALVDYLFMVFFGHNPTDEDIFRDPGDIPRRWQVRLMPGVSVVSDASSTLLFPLPPGSVFPRPPSRVASEVGIKLSSVLRISRLFDSGGTSVYSFSAASAAPVSTTTSLPLAPSADPVFSSLVNDGELAVARFSARLEAWRRDVPLFSSLPSATFDPAFGASVGAVISAQLAGVRAALSTSRAALFSEVCSYSISVVFCVLLVSSLLFVWVWVCLVFSIPSWWLWCGAVVVWWCGGGGGSGVVWCGVMWCVCDVVWCGVVPCGVMWWWWCGVVR